MINFNLRGHTPTVFEALERVMESGKQIHINNLYEDGHCKTTAIERVYKAIGHIASGMRCRLDPDTGEHPFVHAIAQLMMAAEELLRPKPEKKVMESDIFPIS